jgi:hypothetical protein
MLNFESNDRDVNTATVLVNPQLIQEQLNWLGINDINNYNNTTMTKGCGIDVVLQYLSLGFEASKHTQRCPPRRKRPSNGGWQRSTRRPTGTGKTCFLASLPCR